MDLYTTAKAPQIFARIGDGEKIHPAFLMELPGRDGRLHTELHFSCRCPGTRSGSAHQRARIVRGATHATCGN